MAESAGMAMVEGSPSLVDKAVAALEGKQAPAPQAETPSPTTETPKPAEPQVSALDAKIAEIAAERAALEESRRQAEADKAALQKEKETLARIKDLPLQERISVLRQYGVSPSEIAAMVLDEQAKTPEQKEIEATKAKLKEIEDWKASQEKLRQEEEERRSLSEKEQQEKQFIEVQSKWADHFFNEAVKQGEKYELISKFPEFAKSEAVRMVTEWHAEASKKGEDTPEKMPKLSELADRIEKHLDGLVQVALSTKRYGSKAGGGLGTTLTSALKSSTAAASTDKSKLSIEQRALLALEGKLQGA